MSLELQSTFKIIIRISKKTWFLLKNMQIADLYIYVNKKELIERNL